MMVKQEAVMEVHPHNLVLGRGKQWRCTLHFRDGSQGMGFCYFTKRMIENAKQQRLFYVVWEDVAGNWHKGDEVWGVSA